MKRTPVRRFGIIGLACLAGAAASTGAALLSGAAPSLDSPLVPAAASAGLLLPLGLSLFNVVWRDTLYQNLRLWLALAFNLCFDLVFVTLLGLGAAWMGGIAHSAADLLRLLPLSGWIAAYAVLALALAVHHGIQLTRLILGKRAFGALLGGAYKTPRVENRFVLAIELHTPQANILATGSAAWADLLNDFYQDLEEAALRFDGELAELTPRGGLVLWRELPGGPNQDALNAVFRLRAAVERRAAWYRTTYQHVPLFRAVLHHGTVIRAEMGWSHKRLLTLGDAPEFATRLLPSGQKAGEDFLVTEAAMDRLVLPAGTRIHRSLSAQDASRASVGKVYALEQFS